MKKDPTLVNNRNHFFESDTDSENGWNFQVDATTNQNRQIQF